MITRTARIETETETDIASLARAFFRVERGRGGENLMERGEMALLAANPSLRTESVLVPGRRIIVPQVDGLILTARVTDDGESIGDPAVEALAGLGRIATTFKEGAETARLQRERLLERANGEEVRDIVERDLGGATAVLNRAVAATRRTQQLENTRLETLRTALDAARDAFEAFAQRGSGIPGRTESDDTPR
jgi:hypothetical protein